MVKVKICGITNIADAVFALESGCDALGFIFYPKSPRYISPLRAYSIIKQLPRHVTTIGVFVNARVSSIKKIVKTCGLKMIQLHGNESPAFCSKLSSYKVIKAFRVQKGLDSQAISRYKTFAYLFDTYVKGKAGGTGEQFDWKLVRHFVGLKKPIFLAGGLTKDNVRQAIRSAHPAWVDACTSLESCPGCKDQNKVRGFIRAVKPRGDR